jgi:hypothetical protein
MNATNDAIFHSAVRIVAAEIAKDPADWEDHRIGERITTVFKLLKGAHGVIRDNLTPSERRPSSADGG